MLVPRFLACGATLVLASALVAVGALTASAPALAAEPSGPKLAVPALAPAAPALEDTLVAAQSVGAWGRIHALVVADVEIRAQAAAAAAAAAKAAAHTKLVADASHTIVSVWASGFQSQLNQCKGAVDLSGAYGLPVIGERWDCGGSQFPAAGTLVTLTGVRSGIYRVGGVAAVLNAWVSKSWDIPRGNDLLFQTCRGNNAATETFTVLTRVG